MKPRRREKVRRLVPVASYKAIVAGKGQTSGECLRPSGPNQRPSASLVGGWNICLSGSSEKERSQIRITGGQWIGSV